MAAVVATVSVVVTGVLGGLTAMDLVERVNDFQRFDAPGVSAVEVAEPGDHSVYYEYLSGTGGPSDVDPDVTVTVTGPDGSDVAVRPSDVTYGWGSRQAVAVGSFDAAHAGTYEVLAEGYGRLAVGRSIPSGWLYGFGGTAVAGAVGVVASLVLAVVVGIRRRRARRAGGSAGPGGPPGVAAARMLPGPDLPGHDAPSPPGDPRWPAGGRAPRRRPVAIAGLAGGVLATVLAAAVVIGGGPEDPGSRAGTGDDTASATEPESDGNEFVGITSVVGADDRSLTVSTDPVPVEVPPGPCRAEVTPRLEETQGEVVVTVDVRADRPRLDDDPARDANGFPIPWEGCTVESRQVTLALAAPIGQRVVTDQFGSRFWLRDGRWVGCDHVVMTCVTDPASCDNTTLRDSIANADVPRHFRMDTRCEEPFAVVDVDYGAGACPQTGDPGPNPCAGQIVHRQYWRIEDEAWVLVAMDDSAGCGQVHQQAPDFPAHLCADLPSLPGRSSD